MIFKCQETVIATFFRSQFFEAQSSQRSGVSVRVLSLCPLCLCVSKRTELGMRPHYVSKEVNKMSGTNVTFLPPNLELHYSNVDHLSRTFYNSAKMQKLGQKPCISKAAQNS